MKKKIILLFIMGLLFPLKICAIEYHSQLTGNDTLLINAPDYPSYDPYIQRVLTIDIPNLENISSFTMYVKYDPQFISLHTCSPFNYLYFCSVRSDDSSIIYYNFENADGRFNDDIESYSFYNIVLKASRSAQLSDTTQIEVFFEDAKDMDQNPITITSSKMSYKFQKYGMVWNPPKEDETETSNNQNESSEEQITVEPNKENNQTVNNSNPTESTKEDNTPSEIGTEKVTQPTNNNSVIVDNNSSNLESKKSDNNFARKIEIENYNINFEKENLEYNIYVDKDINQLNLSVTVDDENATYNIVGADNIKENDNQIFIEIIAENGTKRTYTINVNEKEKPTIESLKQENQTEKTKEKKKTLIVLGIVALSIILIGALILLFLLNRNNRKIEKQIDQL